MFDVFLCHNSKDKPEVKEIGQRLKQRGLKPWLDEWELQPGLPWQRELERQIKNIKSAAVFVGNSGIGPWQEMEIEAYLRRFVRQGSPVIPVLLYNAPNEPELPIFLEGMTWVDFRHSESNPIERLIWGITGKKTDSNASQPLQNVLASMPFYIDPHELSEHFKILNILEKIIPTQFNRLLFLLNVPIHLMPSSDKPQTERAIALLGWAKSPSGCGLEKIKQVLQQMGIVI